jgi:DNA polymerase I-like protein with 3'-5' exonuclease and polymerase domains
LVLAKLKPLLEDPAILKIGQNLKYDLIMFRRSGIDVAPYDDTMLLSYDLDAGLGGHGMDDLAKRHLDMPASSSRMCAAPARTRSRSTRCRSIARPNMPPRMPT